MAGLKDLQKRELEIAIKLDDFIVRRDRLNSDISMQGDDIDSTAAELKSAKVDLLTGASTSDKASLQLESELNKLIADDSKNRQNLNLVTEAIKRLRQDKNALTQQIRSATRDKLRSSAHSKSEIESELKELAIRYLIAIEIESGVVATSINIGRALEWAVIGKEGFGRSQLMNELTERKDSILSEVTA